MYWGDASTGNIEKANLDGSGRKILLADTKSTFHYFAFEFHANNIYFTDWRHAYVFYRAMH